MSVEPSAFGQIVEVLTALGDHEGAIAGAAITAGAAIKGTSTTVLATD
jgi:hypothetical protein